MLYTNLKKKVVRTDSFVNEFTYFSYYNIDKSSGL